MENNIERITINSEVSHGKPSIRNMRFTVAQLLELLAAGMTHEEILEDYPYLEQEDIEALFTAGAELVLFDRLQLTVY